MHMYIVSRGFIQDFLLGGGRFSKLDVCEAHSTRGARGGGMLPQFFCCSKIDLGAYSIRILVSRTNSAVMMYFVAAC